MEGQNRCSVCHGQAFQKCGGCQNVYYCSKEHQRIDWKLHKKNCQSWKVLSDCRIGRYLVATRDLKPNDIVLRERPLIYALIDIIISGKLWPAQETVPVCLGCNQEISATNYRPCSKCGWPMCGDKCESDPCHLPECSYFIKGGEKVSIEDFGCFNSFYQCLLVLRCLHQRKHNFSLWEKLLSLESHCEQRKLTPKYSKEKLIASEIKQKFLRFEDQFDIDEIMKIFGIIMVNAHEVPLSEPPYVAIYDKTSLLENDCSSNCSKSFSNTGDVLITAGHHIKKGDHLSICYSDPLWSTSARRSFLHETKFFWCSCTRCADPTEFGTYFSAVSCQNGKCDGYLLPKSFVTSEQNWSCSKCNYSVTALLVNKLSEKLALEIENLDKNNITICKGFLHKLRTILPKNNCHLVEVKLALSQLIGQLKVGCLAEVTYEDLDLKGILCRELIALTQILIPSEKRVRGSLLFEMHATLVEQARRKSCNPLELGQVRGILEESKMHLIQCIEQLKHEPDVLPEGKVCDQARKNLHALEKRFLMFD